LILINNILNEKNQWQRTQKGTRYQKPHTAKRCE
jgi:hypothetical protein